MRTSHLALVWLDAKLLKQSEVKTTYLSRSKCATRPTVAREFIWAQL